MTGAALSPWFVRPRGTHPARLFCFPYAGSGASAFSGWPDSIDDVQVCPVQFPGRENRLGQPHYGTYENLVAELVGPLAPMLDRPFALFGHCAGVLPAFETAVRLAGLGLPEPACLLVSGRAAPHEAKSDRMLTMTEAELRAELESVIRARGIEPRLDVVDMGMAVLLRDLASDRAYLRDEPVRLGCPIVVVHWQDDASVRVEDLEGWSRYSDSVEIHVVRGGQHDFMTLPAELRALLTSWRRDGGDSDE